MSYEVEICFDGSENFFQGHFPEFPILPGVMQLKLAHDYAEKMLGREIKLHAVKKMKFVHVIRPRDRVMLRLEEKGEGSILYVFSKGDTICSSGVLAF